MNRTRSLPAIDLTTTLTAMGVTEFFYHFHSFTLELAGFAATWWLFRHMLELLRQGLS